MFASFWTDDSFYTKLESVVDTEAKIHFHSTVDIRFNILALPPPFIWEESVFTQCVSKDEEHEAGYWYQFK